MKSQSSNIKVYQYIIYISFGLQMAAFDYYTFQTNLAVKKINEEIEFYEKCRFSNVPLVTEYVTYLKARVGGNKYTPKTLSSIDRSGNKYEINKMNLDEYSKDMNTMTFDRPWNKLKELHKIIKINEFVDSLKYEKAEPAVVDKNKQYVKDTIIEGLKMKKFLKNKSVIEYDRQKMVIISISCLVYNKKKHVYDIDWDL